MKILSPLSLLLALALSAPAATVTYNYTFTNPACASASATNCISGFAVGTVSGGTFTKIAACPLPSMTTGTVTGITCNFTGTAPLGNVTFAVVVAYNDATGTAQLTAPVATGETAVTVVPSGVSGVVVVFP